MTGWAAPTARVVVVMALVVAATVALHGSVPGVAGSAPGAPSALAVALMPVLLLVSLVVLSAGVVISRHRLPLAMPQVGDDQLPRLRFGRLALLAPLGLGVTALIFAAGIVALMLLPGATPTTTPTSPAEPSVPEQRGRTRTAVDAAAAEPSFGPVDLTGPALVGAVGLAIALLAVAVVGLGAAATVVRRPRALAAPPEPELTEPEVDSLTRAAEMGLAAMIAPGQDPRGAIIACYAAMERGLSADRAAAPLISDTPNEVLARAFRSGALRDDSSAHELVTLFEEARFSPHSMLGWQRIRAEQSLRAVLADLQMRGTEVL